MNDNKKGPVGIEHPGTIHTDCHPNNPMIIPDRPIRMVSCDFGRSVEGEDLSGILDRLREDDHARAALRSSALNGEFVPWMSVPPLSDDYPVEVRRWGGPASMMTSPPDPMFNVAGLSWRKTDKAQRSDPPGPSPA